MQGKIDGWRVSPRCEIKTSFFDLLAVMDEEGASELESVAALMYLVNSNRCWFSFTRRKRKYIRVVMAEA